MSRVFEVVVSPSQPGRRRATLLVLAQFAVATAACAQIYTGTDGSGTIVLSNHESSAAATLLIPAPVAQASSKVTVPTAPASPAPHAPAREAPKAFRELIDEVANLHELPAALLTAVIFVESAFDVRAVSPKGAKGLMQLMPETARRYGVRDVFAPHDNLHGGAAYLRQLMHLFENDLPLALAAYNAGEGAVMRAGRRIPPYPETQQYVAKVLAHAGVGGTSVLKPR